MLLTCPQADLIKALTTASKAVNLNNTLPVLNNILLKAEGRTLTFAATNLEIAITTKIKAEIKNEGSLTVPARLITSYVGLLAAGDVELTNQDGLELQVRSKKSKTKIKGISSDEFPLIPQVKRENSLQVLAADLLSAIDQVAFAAARDMVRPVLAGVALRVTPTELRFAATDSYRLSEKMLTPLKAPADELSLIVPVRTLQELARILEPEQEPVTIDISGTQILFLYRDVELASRLIEGSYPDYTPIIPKTHTTKITVVTSELINAVKRVSLFAKESHSIKLAVNAERKLEIYSDATQIGEERAEVEATIEGVENAVALNSNYLLEGLSALGGTETVIELGEKTAPVIFRPGKGKGYLHLIMPLKI
jgi:DNA polymerase-3 subunit beta